MSKKESEVSRLKDKIKVLEEDNVNLADRLEDKSVVLVTISHLLGTEDYRTGEIISRVSGLVGREKKSEGAVRVEQEMIQRLHDIIEAQIEPRILLKKYENRERINHGIR